MDLTIRKEGDRDVVRLGEGVIQRNEIALNANIAKTAKQKGLEKWKSVMERKNL